MHTVTLAPHGLLGLRRPYRLTVPGLGINDVRTFGDEILAGPTSRPIATLGAHGTVQPATAQKSSHTVWNAATRHFAFWKILHGR